MVIFYRFLLLQLVRMQETITVEQFRLYYYYIYYQ